MSARRSSARHRAAAASRRPTIKGMLASASAAGAASLIAVVAAGGTYALWDGQQAIPAATIASGSMGLTVNNLASAPINTAPWSTLLPGDVVWQEVTVKNTGTVSGIVTASTTDAGPLLVHVKKAACSVVIGGTSSTVSPVSLGTFTASEAATVCVQVTMPANAPAVAQGTAYSFIVTFTSTSTSGP